MIDVGAIQFLRPAWLLGLLALPLAALWWRARQRRRSAWRAHVDAHLLPHLIEASATRQGLAGLVTLLSAVVLAVMALAGPSWRTAPLPLQRSGAPLVVALQLASSTRASDLPPSRLLQARARIARILASRAGAPVGLLVYADDAFVVAPLTDDAANVALFLDSLSPDIMPVDGNRPDRAIDLAARLLQQGGADGGEILLVADGAPGGEALAAAARAGAQGFKVSTLGMGREAGATYRAADGTLAQARLDAGSLQALAAAGGGAYRGWDAGPGMATGLSASGSMPPGDEAAAPRGSTSVALDGGYWLLPPLLALVLLAFRRGAAVAMLAVCLCLPWRPASAQGAVQGTAWRRPDQVAHAQDQAAEAAFRRGDFAAAARAWARPGDADAHYNRGNALAREGRYPEAIAAYDGALQAQPGMSDALANRAAVRAAMQRKPPPGPGKGKSGAPDTAPSDGQPQPGAGKPGTGKPAGDGAQGDGKPGAADARPASPPPAAPDPSRSDAPAEPTRPDARAGGSTQRQADAAQRRAMDKALAKASPGAAAAGTPVPRRAETAAERERRQADEAWLKRIPDDPGGLLRAKFRLEHERRQRSGDAQ